MSVMTLAIIGAGKMGEALAKGLLAKDVLERSDITVSDVSEERRGAIAESYGVRVTSNNSEAAAGADVVLLAVKPQHIDEVLGALSPVIAPEQLVVSIAAGVTIERISSYLADGVPVVRAMPNTAAQIGKAVTAVSAGRFAGEAQMAAAAWLLSAIGEVVVIDEDLQNSAVAVSGSGPAYFYLFADALVEAGVEHGLSREDAFNLTVKTMTGAAEMLAGSGKSPQELIEEVASPGGTTVAALEAFEASDLRASVSAAVSAAVKRAGELG